MKIDDLISDKIMKKTTGVLHNEVPNDPIMILMSRKCVLYIILMTLSDLKTRNAKNFEAHSDYGKLMKVKLRN